MVYGTYNYSIHGVINQLITGGPHIVGLDYFSFHFNPRKKRERNVMKRVSRMVYIDNI